MSYLDLLKFASPEAIVAATALIVLGLHAGSRIGPKLGAPVAIVGLLCAGYAIYALPAHGSLFEGMLVISPLNSLFKIICLALTLLVVLLARGEKFAHQGEFLALLLLATIGLLLLIGSEELLMIFIGLELAGLPLYLMTAFDKSRPRGAEAGLKYFLFGSTASAVALFGLSLIYGMTGTTRLAEIAHQISALPAAPLLAAGVAMTLVGFAFKIAAAPFHLWAPDAYQGAPASTAAFIASASKVASFVALGKILLIGFGAQQGHAAVQSLLSDWAPLVALLAAISIIVGNITALAQTSLSRLLAYSAVAHSGYALLGLLAGKDGFTATLFYVAVYAVTLIGAFSVVAFVRRQTGGEVFADFAGLHARSPLLAGCLTILMLSLAGLPPLPGFFGKFYLFSAAIQTGRLTWLVALALAGSLVSVYYYLMVIKTIFVDEPAAWSPGRISIGLIDRVLLLAVGCFVLVIGLLPDLLLEFIPAI